MKKNKLHQVTHFLFRYIWVFCALLITIEILFTFGTATVLMQESSKGIIRSVCGEVSGRVDGVLRLLQGLARDTRISDLSIPLYDRAILARPYQNSYNLYMIALTDQDVNVISCDEEMPPKKPTSLAYRQYMQDMYATGDYQITDAFVAGADNVTMNYTIAVPIILDNKVQGSVFGSIYFNNIQEIIEQNLGNNSHFYLMGKENTIMAGNQQELIGKSYLDATKHIRFLGKDAGEINQNMLEGIPGNNWEWEDGQLWYVNYQNVAPTEWTLSYRVPLSSVYLQLLPGVLGKIALYIIICVLIHYLGRKYLRQYFEDIDHVLDRMSSLQREIFQTESASYDNLLDLTKTGLTDQLTGLSTRAVLLEQAPKMLEQNGSGGAILFVDLDDLKNINDTYGHESGDRAIMHFASVLSSYSKACGGFAARYGGDEFIFVMNSISESKVLEITENMCRDFHTTLNVKAHTYQIHASIGVCFFPKYGTSLEELICKADLALYTAKQSGKDRYEVYSDNRFASVKPT